LPPTLYPYLQIITVDDAPLSASQQAMRCIIPWAVGPCRVNIFSNPFGIENPFPGDAPETVTMTVFEQVAAHELAHAISTTVVLYRWGDQWEKDLVAEAGCEPMHYLRSMFPPCYFYDYRQEFFASMMNQWIACSDCMLQLAVSRWKAGNPHPFNALIYVVAVMGQSSMSGGWEPVGHVLAYRNAKLEPWVVRPWRCGGEGEIITEARMVRVMTDDRCRMTALLTEETMP
jgi:hypothetical protein